MFFTIEKTNLVQALLHVNKAVSSKNTIPILTGIKFEIDEKGLTLTGSDSDISIQVNIPCFFNEKEIIKVINSGKIVLPKYIVDIVKKLPTDKIEFELVDQFTLTIKSGMSEFKLNGFDADEYPDLPVINEEKILSVDCNLLRSMIKQTIFSISSNESRPILSGVLLNFENEILKFISTDSHRLAIKEINVDNLKDLELSNIVIPGKSLNELYKILEDYNIYIDITVTDNQILFKLDNLLFLSRLIDGTYPNISKIIPNNSKTNIVLNNNDLLSAIERASLIAKEVKNNVVKLTTLEDNLIEISSIMMETGKVKELIKVKEISGEPVKISFNSKFLLDVLKVIDSDDISIDFTGALSPFVIRPTDSDKMLHLILPIRTY